MHTNNHKRCAVVADDLKEHNTKKSWFVIFNKKNFAHYQLLLNVNLNVQKKKKKTDGAEGIKGTYYGNFVVDVERYLEFHTSSQNTHIYTHL